MTDKHKELADYVVTTLKETPSVDAQTFKKLGGEIYDVLRWLSEKQIINDEKYGYTKGINYYRYKGLENLLLGTDEDEAPTPQQQPPIQVTQTINTQNFNQAIGDESTATQKVTETTRKNKSKWIIPIVVALIGGVAVVIDSFISKSAKPNPVKEIQNSPIDSVVTDSVKPHAVIPIEKTTSSSKPKRKKTNPKKDTTIIDAGETYHVQSENQTGGITAGKVEIHNNAAVYFGVKDNFTLLVDTVGKTIIIYPKIGVWENPFVGILLTEKDSVEPQFRVTHGMQTVVLEGEFDFGGCVKVFGRHHQTPMLSQTDYYMISYKLPPSEIFFGSVKGDEIQQVHLEIKN